MVVENQGIIIYRNGIPTAQLTKYKSSSKKTIGLLKDKINITEDFNDNLPKEMMMDYQ